MQITADSHKTRSLCPVCLSKVDARRIVEDDRVFLEKECTAHGRFRTLIWDGEPAFNSWQRPKFPIARSFTGHAVDKGCPFDCGLCPEHHQRSCTVLIEVTNRCNLNCSVCFADAGNRASDDPSLEEIRTWFERIKQNGTHCNIQLSGGEPTLRNDLPQIVSMAGDSGFSFIQVNTNGIRLARDPEFVSALEKAGLSSVFLQFDGTHDTIYKTIRGKALLDIKMAAIRACRENRIGVVLVPTIIPGINTDNIGNIIQTAIDLSPAVRAVHFQPMSYFGRFSQSNNSTKKRITLPGLMRRIEAQTDGMCRLSDFKPPGCENALCSFHGNFMVSFDNRLVPLHGQADKKCCPSPIPAPAPIPAEVGSKKAISYVARQWTVPEANIQKTPTPGSTHSGPDSGPISLDSFISRARTHTLSISAMAFQDAWNLDLERVQDCCIHVFSKERFLVPFCLYNLTNKDGKSLYRP